MKTLLLLDFLGLPHLSSPIQALSFCCPTLEISMNTAPGLAFLSMTLTVDLYMVLVIKTAGLDAAAAAWTTTALTSRLTHVQGGGNIPYSRTLLMHNVFLYPQG